MHTITMHLFMPGGSTLVGGSDQAHGVWGVGGVDNDSDPNKSEHKRSHHQFGVTKPWPQLHSLTSSTPVARHRWHSHGGAHIKGQHAQRTPSPTAPRSTVGWPWALGPRGTCARQMTMTLDGALTDFCTVDLF